MALLPSSNTNARRIPRNTNIIGPIIESDARRIPRNDTSAGPIPQKELIQSLVDEGVHADIAEKVVCSPEMDLEMLQGLEKMGVSAELIEILELDKQARAEAGGTIAPTDSYSVAKAAQPFGSVSNPTGLKFQSAPKPTTVWSTTRTSTSRLGQV